MRLWWFLLLPALAARGEDGAVRVDSASGGVRVENGLVRLLLERQGDAWRERYYAQDGVLLLEAGSDQRPDPSLYCDRGDRPLAFREVRILSASPESAAVELRADAEGHAVRRQVVLRRGGRYFRVTVHDQTAGTHEFAHLLSTYAFVPGGEGPPDFLWTPVLRPDSSDVIGDHVFRTPGLMMQKGARFAALIPEVELIQPWRSIQTAGDLQVRGTVPFFSYGAMNWRVRSHVFYTHSREMTTLLDDSRITYGYLLYLRSDAPPRGGFADVVRLAWNRWGRKNLLSGRGPQAEPFRAYVRKAWEEYLPSVLVETSYAGRPVALLKQERLAWSNKLPKQADNDCWFNVWFNALRTAYGMELRARRAKDSALARHAEEVLALALAAPRQEGIAPSIFYVDSAGGHWVNDHGWGGIDGGRNFAMFHNAWTNFWLLQWADLLPGWRREIHGAACAFGDFLVRMQRPSGVIPSWYDPRTLEPVPTLRDENAESAGAGMLLAELYARTREKSYLDAAERVAAYITREILPRQKWFDFETFFSCSRKPVGFFDPWTGQVPQNTLSMHQAAEMFLSLWRITGKGEYLSLGRSVLDYLCLYQQVWSPRWLSCELFGGFGVQNTDGEWSDSRQGYFAVTLIRYYEATGEREYFERGVAALRAMFSLFESPTSPRTAENYAHSATDHRGGVTGLHWGTGSSVTSIHILEQRYGGAFVDVGGSWGCGIDGCTVMGVRAGAGEIRLEIRDDVRTPRPLRLTFGHLGDGPYRVVVNGGNLGIWTSQDLEKGIDFAL